MSELRHGPRLMARLDELGQVSAEPGRLVRLPFTPQHRQALDLVGGWMADAGMQVRVDAIGNLVGRYEGTSPDAAAILIGSHLDSVIDAGRYDGPLGVLAGIEAVAALHADGIRLPFAVEIVGFCDEEGVRFTSTFLGSRALCGTFDPRTLALRDRDGVTIAEALTGFGLDPERIGAAARRRDEILAYLEVHIEQGPVLEVEDRRLGIVTAIQGQSRLVVTVEGMAGHAGTLPMALRRDALAGAAEIVLFVERRCAALTDMVGTVGALEVRPGAINVVPGEVILTIDLRSPNDLTRSEITAEVEQACRSIAAARGLGVSVARSHEQRAVACAPRLQRQLAAALRAEGLPVKYLSSGAGHDAMAVAEIWPVGMLFVRCRGGISHHPSESITTEDADAAVRVLRRWLDDQAHAEQPLTKTAP